MTAERQPLREPLRDPVMLTVDQALALERALGRLNCRLLSDAELDASCALTALIDEVADR